MNKIEKIKLKRIQIASLFGGKCYICQKKIRKGFSFHHISYRYKELIHSDFTSWIGYNEYVLPIIQRIPEKFALLCNKCHRLVSIMQAIKSDTRFERLVKLTRDSRK